MTPKNIITILAIIIVIFSLDVQATHLLWDHCDGPGETYFEGDTATEWVGPGDGDDWDDYYLTQTGKYEVILNGSDNVDLYVYSNCTGSVLCSSTTGGNYERCTFSLNSAPKTIHVKTANNNLSVFGANYDLTVKLIPTCTANAYTACYDNDRYYYNSCNQLGSIAEDCGSGSSTHWSYYCTNNTAKKTRDVTSKGCNNNSCYADTNPEIQTMENCSNGTGYTGNNFCFDNDVYRNYVTSTCTATSSDAYCSDNSSKLKQQECGQTTNGNWSASYCSGDLIQQSRTKNLGGCSNGNCQTGTQTEYQTIEDCNNRNYPDPFQFYCSGSQLRQKRLFHDYTCTSGPTCTQVTPYYIDDSLIENCQFGCSNGSCLRPNYKPTSIEYVRP